MSKNRRRLGLITKSPVLTIDQVRTVFELGEPSIDASPMPKQKPHLSLIGHAFEGDFKVLEETGVRPIDLYDLAGIIDTKILIKDLYETVNAGTDWPLGLAQLVLRYDLHQQVGSPRARSWKGAYIFKGCHNGGNDAIANLEVLICLILDPTFGIDYFNCNEEDFQILANETMHQLQTTDIINLLLNPKSHSTFLCFDFEGVDGTTSEYGWAWVHSNEVCWKVPGERRKNWRQLICAQHYLNVDFYESKGSRWTDGNSYGFWTAYGQTQQYYPASGAQPFHDMFQSMINDMVKLTAHRRLAHRHPAAN